VFNFADDKDKYYITIMRRFFLTLLMAAGSLFAVAQPNMSDSARHEAPQKGPFFRDPIWQRIKVMGYAQGGYTYIDKDPSKGGAETSTFDMKRAYIFLRANFTDRFAAWVMYDFCGVFNEYYLEYGAIKGGKMSFRLGQQKTPYGLENPNSPTRMELIDVYSQATTYLTGCGSDPLYGVQYGRDLGLVMIGDIADKHIHYELGLLNGQGVNKADRNTKKDFSGRIEVFTDPTFRFVLSGQTGWGNVETNGRPLPYTIPELGAASTLQPGMDYKRQRWAFGAEYRSHPYPGHCDYYDIRPAVLRAEIMGGKDDVYKSLGYYVTGALPLKGHFDAVASYDFMNFNTDLDIKQTNYLIGIQYWFYKSCRVQLQYTRCEPNGGDGYNKIQLQTQVAF